jgi:hypothetical protein
VGSYDLAAWSVAVGDLDVIAGGTDSDGKRVKVWQNDGTPFDGGWSGRTTGTHVFTIDSVAAADLDGDGDLDLASGNNDDTVKVWQNDTTPFTDPWAISQTVGSLGYNVNAVAVGDLDGDGDLDIVSGGNDNKVKAWQNIDGSAGLDVTDTSPGTIPNNTEDDMFKVVFTHNGISGDRTLELNKFDLDLFQSDCSTACASAWTTGTTPSRPVTLR